jgi:ABC-type Fe3+-citrate transport system substrate-binding protein
MVDSDDEEDKDAAEEKKAVIETVREVLGEYHNLGKGDEPSANDVAVVTKTLEICGSSTHADVERAVKTLETILLNDGQGFPKDATIDDVAATVAQEMTVTSPRHLKT